MIRFVHAADLHLDSPLRGLDLKDDAPRELIREAPRRALAALVDLCLTEEAAFLLLAGDIFDGDFRDCASWQFFTQQMRRLGAIPVAMIRGNHDAAGAMAKQTPLPLPPNVTLFGEAPETLRLDALRVAIHGRSFQDRETRANLVREYPALVPGWFNIGLLHTSLAGANAVHDTYAPCSEEQLAAADYDYWALGHIHTREVVRPRRPAIVFPGNLQGRHIRETGPKGAYLVDVNGAHDVELHFRRLDVLRWDAVEHAAAPDADREAVLDAATATVARVAAADDERPLAVRVRIVGRTRAHDALQARSGDAADELRERLLNECRERVWLESLRIETQPPAEDDAGLDDALAELRAVVAEFGRDPEALRTAAAALQPLADKLPKPLLAGDDAPNPTDPAWLAAQLDRVLPLLAEAAQEPRSRTANA